MTSVLNQAMTPTFSKEMSDILNNYYLKEPKTQEEKYKYANATITKIIVNHTDTFKYVFFNDPTHFVELMKWFNKKEKEPFAEKEMICLRIINSCSIKYFGLAFLKEIAIGVFDEDEFYHDLGVPKSARRKFKRSKNESN